MLVLLPFALMAPAPAGAPAAYCDTPKALYAWSCATAPQRDGRTGWWHLLHDTNGCGQRLVDLARAHRIQRVYLFVGAAEWSWAESYAAGVLPEEDALAALTTRLRAAGVEPWALWYLNDDPDDLSGVERIPDLVASVAAFNAAHPGGAFVGLHGDQEPNALPVYQDYLDMNALGQAAAAAAGLGWAASIKPAWLSLDRDGPFFEHVLDRVSLGTLMDYTDSPQRAAAQGEVFLAGADEIDRSAEIAVETGWGDPTPGVSFSDLVRSDPAGFQALLGDLDVSFRAYSSYAGIAIHDYAQYFAGLHGGVEPYDATGAVEVLCPGGAAGDPGGLRGGAHDAPVLAAEGGCGCGTSDGGRRAWGLLALAAVALRRGTAWRDRRRSRLR